MIPGTGSEEPVKKMTDKLKGVTNFHKVWGLGRKQPGKVKRTQNEESYFPMCNADLKGKLPSTLQLNCFRGTGFMKSLSPEGLAIPASVGKQIILLTANFFCSQPLPLEMILSEEVTLGTTFHLRTVVYADHMAQS